jgi:hypothetical protein
LRLRKKAADVCWRLSDLPAFTAYDFASPPRVGGFCVSDDEDDQLLLVARIDSSAPGKVI